MLFNLYMNCLREQMPWVPKFCLGFPKKEQKTAENDPWDKIADMYDGKP